MKTLLLGMLIGAIFWQLVCTITNIISKDDKLTCFAGVGIWYIIVWLITTLIYSPLKQWYNHKKYVAMLIDKNGKPCYCKNNKVPEYLIKEKNFEWNKRIMEKYTIKDGWKEEHCFGCVNIRYTPIKIAKLENAYKIKVSRKELKDW